MSSNPLVMSYEGGDLLLTGAAGQRLGRCPGLCAWAVAWLAGGSGQWREHIRGGLTAGPGPDRRPYGICDDALYKSTFFTFFFTFSQMVKWK